MMKQSFVVKISALALLPVLLASCGPGSTSKNNASSPPSASGGAATAPAAVPGVATISAAAEPFEKLTETAFTAAPTVLDATIAEARTAAQSVRATLAADAATGLDARLAAIDVARKSGNRADLAIAAVEGYRVLVSNATPGAKVPAAVNLLDYAGFRFDADLKAKPTRWADAIQAASFGREQWASISNRVTDAPLRANMDKALTEMASAATRRDSAAGAAAAQRELALVDTLETFFNAR